MFAGGVASLGSEIAAARLLAPYFGASTIVWANTIAVVLVALSVGYWFGGRLADRHPHERALRLTALGAAGLLAVVPLLAGPFLGVAVDAFDEVDAGAGIGSLVGVLILIALPIFLLGTISPWAIRLAIHSVEEAGVVAGRLYAISTIGSLAGVFLAALLLIPLVGTQRTFVTFAALLAAAAAIRLPRLALIAPVALLLLLALPPVTSRGADGPGERVIHQRETEYQSVRVVQDGDQRELELNEGQAVHSLYRPDTVLTDGVWDGYSVLPYAALTQPPERFAMLGNAAGTVSRAYEEFFPRTRIDGVEIDAGVSEVGREWFGMDNPRLTIHDADARPFLRRSSGGYDLIGIDAYRQPYIPFYLATEEFFDLVSDRLAPGGAVVLNVGHPPGNDDLEEVLAATMRTAFDEVMRFPIEDSNTLLVAARGTPVSAQKLRDATAWLPDDVRNLARRAVSELRPALRGGTVYTDDKAPVEWLIDSSIIDYAASGGEDDE